MGLGTGVGVGVGIGVGVGVGTGVGVGVGAGVGELCARLLGFHIREISSSIRLKPPLYPLNYGDSLLSTTYEVALLAAGLRYENFMHF